MGKKLLSAVKYRASLHLVQGDHRNASGGQNGGGCSKKLSAGKYRASLFKALVEGSSSKKPDKKLKRLNDSQEGDNEGVELEGELTPSFSEKICGLAPVIRCRQNGKTSETCIQKDRTEPDIHLEEGYQPVIPEKTDNSVPPEVEEDGGCLTASCCMDLQPARIDNETPQVHGRDQSVMLPGQQELHREIKGILHCQHCSDEDVFTKQQTTDSEEANKSPNNNIVFTKQTSDSEEASGSPDNEVSSTKRQVRDSEEATVSLSTDISKSINLVETIYSKKKGKLLANQLKKRIQFKEERDRIEKESIAKLRKEHLHESACVRKMHLQSEVRLVEMRIADQEFIRKVQIIRNHLDTEQEKLDSMHKAARKEEKVLKCHWLQEAKSGKPVDAFFVLPDPQLSNSCLNLDILKHCEQDHSQELISDETVSLVLCESQVVRGHSPVAEGTNPTEPPDNSFNSSFHITDPLPYNQSNDDISVIPPDVQCQQHPPTISPSEPLGPLLSMLSDNERTVFTQADQLQVSTTTNSSFEPLFLNSSSSDASVFPYARQLELPTVMDSVSELVQSNESEENIPLDVQLQRPLPTDPPSEPGSSTPVSELASISKDSHEPPQTENDEERRATMSGESLAQRRGCDREAQHQTKMETKDCRSIQVQRHNEGELQRRRDIEPQQPHHCCDTFAPQPPNSREREEQQQFRECKRKAVDGELSNDQGHLQTNTRLPDEAGPIINRRAVAQRKRREREAEQTRQYAEMEVARKRLEKKAEQARQFAEMGAQPEKKIKEITTRISRRSLAQRRRREREAHSREMGAQKKKAVNTSFNRVFGSLGSHQGAHFGPLQNHRLLESSCHQNSDRPLMVPKAAPATATITSTSTATQSLEKVVQHSPAIFLSNRPFSSSRGPTVKYQVGSFDSSDLLGGRTSDLNVQRLAVAQMNRRERGEQARLSAVMGAQREIKIQEKTTRISRRSLAQRRRREREAHGREIGAQKKKAVNTSFERVTGSLGSHQGAHLGMIENHQLLESSCHQNSDRPLMVPAPAAATTISTSTATQSPEKVVQHSPAIFSSNRPFSCSRGATVNYQVGSLDSSDLLGGRTGPATAPLLTCLTANIYGIPHSVYPRKK